MRGGILKKHVRRRKSVDFQEMREESRYGVSLGRGAGVGNVYNRTVTVAPNCESTKCCDTLHLFLKRETRYNVIHRRSQYLRGKDRRARSFHQLERHSSLRLACMYPALS